MDTNGHTHTHMHMHTHNKIVLNPNPADIMKYGAILYSFLSALKINNKVSLIQVIFFFFLHK